MSELLGRAVLALSTDSQAFEKGVTGARQKSESLVKAFKVVSGIAVGLGVTFGALAKKSIDQADNFAKMSQRVGVSVEALSGLSHAASLSGLEMESVEKGLQRLSGTVLDASFGLQTYTRTFDELGISIRDSEGNLKNTDTVLLEVADQFSRMEDGTRKTALAMDLFGRAGADMIPMLNQGRAGIEGMLGEAEALGLVIGTDTAQAAERFNDAVEKVMVSLSGVVNQILASGLMDGLTVLAESLADLVVNADDNSTAFTLLAGALSLPIQAFFEIERVIAVLRQKFAEFMIDVLRLVGGANELMGSWSPFGDLTGTLQAQMDQWALSALHAGDEAKAWEDKQRKLTQGLQDSEQPTQRLTDKLKRGLTPAQEDARKEAEELFKQVEKLGEEFRKISIGSNAALPGFEQAARGIDIQVRERTLKIIGDLEDKVKDLNQSIKDNPLPQFKDSVNGLIKPVGAFDSGISDTLATVGQFKIEVPAAISGVGPAVETAKTKIGELDSAFSTFSGSAKGALSELLNGVKGPGEFADQMLDSFKNLGINMLKGLTDHFFDPLLGEGGLLSKGIGRLTGFITDLIPGLGSAAAGTAAGAAGQAAGGAAGTASAVASGVAGGLAGTVFSGIGAAAGVANLFSPFGPFGNAGGQVRAIEEHTRFLRISWFENFVPWLQDTHVWLQELKGAAINSADQLGGWGWRLTLASERSDFWNEHQLDALNRWLPQIAEREAVINVNLSVENVIKED